MTKLEAKKNATIKMRHECFSSITIDIVFLIPSISNKDSRRWHPHQHIFWEYILEHNLAICVLSIKLYKSFFKMYFFWERKCTSTHGKGVGEGQRTWSPTQGWTHKPNPEIMTWAKNKTQTLKHWDTQAPQNIYIF